jgi:hypothetical protein
MTPDAWREWRAISNNLYIMSLVTIIIMGNMKGEMKRLEENAKFLMQHHTI